ncbi:MarR family winged helix-turn-helix transcriptional regulator [Microbulbifer thermotolerans]|uniref:MarR family transcriptional regulator n=1 Tax=Microbulbifer thermotolerans TaxID=252514 RepID=A0A143HRI5_MICTH|nr:MarR family winged helix-turn-helix transcriptional regulator [Microbulbifer thermotolerans]AMX04126.1 MarR family transcriptional regulator [Microbulbifer thermotolerans]
MSSPSISEALLRLMHAYKSRMRRALQDEQLGVPITHIRALKGICRHPDCTAQSVAQWMQRDKAQITRVLNDLLGEGLIEKRDNPADRRSQLLLPTPKGEALMGQLQNIERQTAAAMTKNLDREEVAQFVRLAAAMAKNLGGDPESPQR